MRFDIHPAQSDANTLNRYNAPSYTAESFVHPTTECPAASNTAQDEANTLHCIASLHNHRAYSVRSFGPPTTESTSYMVQVHCIRSFGHPTTDCAVTSNAAERERATTGYMMHCIRSFVPPITECLGVLCCSVVIPTHYIATLPSYRAYYTSILCSSYRSSNAARVDANTLHRHIACLQGSVLSLALPQCQHTTRCIATEWGSLFLLQPEVCCYIEYCRKREVNDRLHGAFHSVLCSSYHGVFGHGVAAQGAANTLPLLLHCSRCIAYLQGLLHSVICSSHHRSCLTVLMPKARGSECSM